MNITQKTLSKQVKILLALFLLSFSLLAYASDTSSDTKIKKENTQPSSKCGAGKCGAGKCGISNKVKPGMSHGSKCGTSNSKCGGGESHGSKCGSKCGSGKCGSN